MIPPSEEGFYERKGGKTSYITILGIKDAKGKPQAVFAESVNEGDKGAVSRKNKNDKIVWERYHSAYGATIKAVYIRDDSKYGNQLCIRTKSKTIQVPMNSNHAKKFIAVCHNIDLDQLVLLEPYKMPKKDKNNKPIFNDKGEPMYISGWTIKQGGEEKENKLEDALDTTKDGPVPAFVKLKNGTWDTSDHDEYLENYLQEWIDEHDLNTKKDSVTENDNEEEETNSDTDDEDEDEDDTPPPSKTVKKTKKKSSYSIPF